MEREFAVVYMVAGLSSRFGGRIKQFAKVGPNGESLIEYSINQAIEAGFNKFFFIVGEKTQGPFYDLFGDFYKGFPIEYTKQVFDSSLREKPWGTCDAVCTLGGVINCPFVICNGDDIYGEGAFRILLSHLKSGSKDCVTLGYGLLETLPEAGSVNRGIFEMDDYRYVKKIDERLNISKDKINFDGIDPSSLVSMNIFGLYPWVVEMLDDELLIFKEKNKDSRVSECYLPVELSNLIDEGKVKMKCIPTSERWLGVTNPEDEESVRKELLESRG